MHQFRTPMACPQKNISADAGQWSDYVKKSPMPVGCSWIGVLLIPQLFPFDKDIEKKANALNEFLLLHYCEINDGLCNIPQFNGFWTPAANVSQGLEKHAASALDGTVIVTGGFDGDFSKCGTI